MTVVIDGEHLTIDEVVQVSRHKKSVELAEAALDGILASRDVVESTLAEGKIVYGVNTGFGDLSNVSISPNDLARLQVNLIRSHSAGVGPPFSEEVVRGMMLLRANALAKGYSGVRLEVIEALIEMLNKDVVPIVPQQGSVGSSGDLAPLAHMALVLIGEGRASYKGTIYSGAEAMQSAQITPISLEAKEGVALINGTQPMSSVGCLVVHDALTLVRNAIVASAMSLEALRGTRTAFDERIHMTRRHEGQLDIARTMLDILRDSEINKSHENCGKVQDAYSLRCIPQVLGASLDSIRYARFVLEIEINSATDNPLVFADEKEILSGGNFHGQPIAIAMDLLGIVISEIANISERRINRLVNAHLSGLPPFLTTEGGLESGLMIAQYTAASLVSENKVLAHPASVDSIPTSADQEDHVSMGTIAARKAMQILQNAENVIAIEYLCASQGIDLLSPLAPSQPITAAMSSIREVVPMIQNDRPLHDDISSIQSMIRTGHIIKCVEAVTGSILEE